MDHPGEDAWKDILLLTSWYSHFQDWQSHSQNSIPISNLKEKGIKCTLRTAPKCWYNWIISPSSTWFALFLYPKAKVADGLHNSAHTDEPNGKSSVSHQSAFPYDNMALSPSLQKGYTGFVDESRSRSFSPRLTACPKQMGDSGNWHQGLLHAVAALALSLSPEKLHLYLFARCLSSVYKREIRPRSPLSGTQAHTVRSVCTISRFFLKFLCWSGAMTF